MIDLWQIENPNKTPDASVGVNRIIKEVRTWIDKTPTEEMPKYFGTHWHDIAIAILGESK